LASGYVVGIDIRNQEHAQQTPTDEKNNNHTGMIPKSPYLVESIGGTA
jgi:hypothetical protein